MDNSVILLGTYGNDQRVALSAWQSTAIELGIDLPDNYQDTVQALFEATQKTKAKDYGNLLAFLAKHKHHSPWEKTLLDFQLTADVATHIQVIKHRVAIAVNSESARYKQLKDKYYCPEDWAEIIITEEDVAAVAHLPTDVKAEPGQSLNSLLTNHSDRGNYLYHLTLLPLTRYLGRARAKESARYFLGYNKQLNFDLAFNMRSFAHFCHLRAKPEAQKEIRELALKMITLVKETHQFDVSLKVLGLLSLLDQ